MESLTKLHLHGLLIGAELKVAASGMSRGGRFGGLKGQLQRAVNDFGAEEGLVIMGPGV